jgi:hypothetical protein
VTARDLQGELTLESVSGNVAIANGGRVGSAKTISGNVEVTGTTIDGALDASSVSGTVAVRKTKARRMTLATVSGNVAIEDVDCARVEMQAVSGDVDLTGALGGRPLRHHLAFRPGPNHAQRRHRLRAGRQLLQRIDSVRPAADRPDRRHQRPPPPAGRPRRLRQRQRRARRHHLLRIDRHRKAIFFRAPGAASNHSPGWLPPPVPPS